MTAPEGRMTLVVWPTYVGLASDGEATLPPARRAPIHWSQQQVGRAECPTPAGVYDRLLFFMGPEDSYPPVGMVDYRHSQDTSGVHVVDGLADGDLILAAYTSPRT